MDWISLARIIPELLNKWKDLHQKIVMFESEYLFLLLLYNYQRSDWNETPIYETCCKGNVVNQSLKEVIELTKGN